MGVYGGLWFEQNQSLVRRRWKERVDIFDASAPLRPTPDTKLPRRHPSRELSVMLNNIISTYPKSR